MIISWRYIKKTVIGLVLVFILGACTKFILPEDTRIVVPAAGISKIVANYSGTWEGNWRGEEGRIVIEAIEPPKVRAVYAWGTLKRP